MSEKKCKKLGKKLYNIIMWLSGMGGAMKTVLKKEQYPDLVTNAEFESLVAELETRSPREYPDVSVTYQDVETGIRILAVGTMDECARISGGLLRKNPSFRKVRVRAERIRISRSRFQCI